MTLKSGEPSWSQQVEQTFLVVYTLELILRVLGGNAEIFQSCWFLMDWPTFFFWGGGVENFEHTVARKTLNLK